MLVPTAAHYPRFVIPLKTTETASHILFECLSFQSSNLLIYPHLRSETA